MTRDYSTQKVLITGAASGMGRLLALRYAARGSCVIAWDIDESGLDTLCDETRDGSIRPYICDLIDPQAIANTAQQVLKSEQYVDILINNAGIVSGAPFTELTDAAVVRTFAVNVLAPMRVVRAFLPNMISRGSGHIVNVASAGGFVGAPRLSDYCASKFAAVGFDESLRLELRTSRSPVRTTLIAPFFVDTGMFSGVRSRFPLLLPVMKPEYVVSRIIRAVDRGRKRLILPFFVYVLFPLRLLPVTWSDRLLEFFGITSAMDSFSGRR